MRAVERLNAQAPGPRAVPARVAQGAVYLRCPYLLTDYFGLIVSSIAETLEMHGRPLLLNAGEAAQQAAVLPTLASRPGISGAIIVLPPEPSEQLVDLRARGFPFRRGGSPRPDAPRHRGRVSGALRRSPQPSPGTWSIWGTGASACSQDPHNWLASDARVAGHTSALANVGVLPDPALVRSGEATAKFGYHAASELLDLPQRPTALVGFNDKVAVGALAAAAQRGLRVPEDLSVTGFDDIDLAQATRPLLTTTRQPLQEMGRLAVSLLIRLLERQRLDALHVELATELIVRDSTGPAPAA